MRGDAILVTGATGFIGRRLLARLLAEGFSVIYAVRDASALPSGSVRAVRWSLEDASALDDDVLAGVRAVCHFAAFLPPSFHDAAYADACLRLNALGTLRLLERVAAAGVPTFVNVSSGNAYQTGRAMASEDDPLYPSERAPYYLASKLVQEVYGDHFGRRGAMRVVTLRPSAVYGPGMRPFGLVPTLAHKLANGEPVELDDGGRYCADLVYVDDVVDACLGALHGAASGPYNVGSGERSTTLEVARALAEALGAADELIRVQPPRTKDGGGFPGLDMSRTRAELGVRSTPLKEGLRRYVASLDAP